MRFFFFSKIALGIKHEIDHLCAPGKSCHLENNLTGLDGSDLLPKPQSPALGNREGRAEGIPVGAAKAWMGGRHPPTCPWGTDAPHHLASLANPWSCPIWCSNPSPRSWGCSWGWLPALESHGVCPSPGMGWAGMRRTMQLPFPTFIPPGPDCDSSVRAAPCVSTVTQRWGQWGPTAPLGRQGFPNMQQSLGLTGQGTPKHPTTAPTHGGFTS